MATEHLRFFKNRYERAIGKRGRSYVFIPVLECKKGNFHYHLVLDRPTNLSHDEYMEKVSIAISKVKQVHRDYNKLEAAGDVDRWVKYITKLKNPEDEFDIQNLNR